MLDAPFHVVLPAAHIPEAKVLIGMFALIGSKTPAALVESKRRHVRPSVVDEFQTVAAPQVVVPLSFYVAFRTCRPTEELLLGELGEDPKLPFLGEGTALLQGTIIGQRQDEGAIPVYRDPQRLSAGTATHLEGQIVAHSEGFSTLLHGVE